MLLRAPNEVKGSSVNEGRPAGCCRLYLINPSFVASFERLKDNAICHLSIPALARVPVSRSRLKDVREALGI